MKSQVSNFFPFEYRSICWEHFGVDHRSQTSIDEPSISSAGEFDASNFRYRRPLLIAPLIADRSLSGDFAASFSLSRALSFFVCSPDLARRVTRSQAINNSDGNKLPVSRKIEESEKSIPKSRQR